MSGIYQAYGALLLSALLPIGTGAHASLLMPKEARRALRISKGEKEAPSEDEEEDEEIDRLTASDAALFPVIGSVVLLALFFAFKYLDKQLINRLLGFYFTLMGTAALARVLASGAKAVTPEHIWRAIDKWKIALLKNKSNITAVTFTWVHVVAGLAAVAVAAYQRLAGDHWALSNLVALSLSFNAITLLRIDTFYTGAALLGGLFLYDIWWVFGSSLAFGSNVMVSVAQNFEAPIKIVWPKDYRAADSGFTLLGLGDIVLPGVFVALALRFDYHLALKRNASSPPRPSSAFAKPYFWSCWVAYICGLVTTIAVMHSFQAAQPALLYLSPACVGSVLMCAWWRDELALLWGFDDGENDPKPPEKEKGYEPQGEEAKSTATEEAAVENGTLRSRATKS